jgi:hypothetical protein
MVAITGARLAPLRRRATIDIRAVMSTIPIA